MIRVAHVWRETDAGGSEATFMRLYATMDRAQVQWDFLVENTGFFIDEAFIRRLGGRVILVPPLTRPRAYQRALRAIFQREHYDIVHAHMNELSYYPLKAAKAAGVPVRIAHAHSGRHWRDWGKTLIKTWLRPRVGRVATHQWAVSEQSARQTFGAQALADGRVTVFRNALDLAPCAFDVAAREQARSQLKIGNHSFVVGHVGRLTRQKNHQWLIRVFAALARRRADAVLLLVGDGSWMKRIQKQIARRGLVDRVRMVGNQAAIAPYYQAMDVLVLPSLYEGLPGVAVEAQANGLPCVLADTITAEAVLTAGTTRLPLKNVGRWVDAVLDAGALRGHVAVDPTVLAPFDRHVQAKRLVALYQSMVDGGAA